MRKVIIQKYPTESGMKIDISVGKERLEKLSLSETKELQNILQRFNLEEISNSELRRRGIKSL